MHNYRVSVIGDYDVFQEFDNDPAVYIWVKNEEVLIVEIGLGKDTEEQDVIIIKSIRNVFDAGKEITNVISTLIEFGVKFESIKIDSCKESIEVDYSDQGPVLLSTMPELEEKLLKHFQK